MCSELLSQVNLATVRKVSRIREADLHLSQDHNVVSVYLKHCQSTIWESQRSVK